MRLEKRSSLGWGPTPAPAAPCKNGMVAHYNGGNTGLIRKDHQACRTYWVNTRNFHVNGRGWLDIGYSYGCCPHGIVLEGRGFGKSQAAQPGGNTTWTSCTFMSGPDEAPTAAQLNAWRELRAWLRGKGLAAAVRGHRDFNSTSCPGPIVYRMVGDGTLTGAPDPAPEPPAPPKPAPVAPKWPGRYITQPPAMRGTDVRTWQKRMRDRGWRIAVDGWYGPKSEAICRAFQKEKRLGVDGIVGPDTWRAAWAAPVT